MKDLILFSLLAVYLHNHFSISFLLIFVLLGQPRFTTGKWNPQSVNLQFVTADDCNIKAWDLRSQAKVVWSLDGVHTQVIRYNEV